MARRDGRACVLIGDDDRDIMVVNKNRRCQRDWRGAVTRGRMMLKGVDFVRNLILCQNYAASSRI
jgi:hypothetical protein